jgi:amino acid transporter
MYILLFASAIRLRYSQPDLPRPYRIVGGKPVIWLLGGLGIVVSAIGFCLGLFPPAQVLVQSEGDYLVATLFGDFLILGIPLLLLYSKRQKHA